MFWPPEQFWQFKLWAKFWSCCMGQDGCWACLGVRGLLTLWGPDKAWKGFLAPGEGDALSHSQAPELAISMCLYLLFKAFSFLGSVAHLWDWTHFTTQELKYWGRPRWCGFFSISIFKNPGISKDSVLPLAACSSSQSEMGIGSWYNSDLLEVLSGKLL